MHAGRLSCFSAPKVGLAFVNTSEICKSSLGKLQEACHLGVVECLSVGILKGVGGGEGAGRGQKAELAFGICWLRAPGIGLKVCAMATVDMSARPRE